MSETLEIDPAKGFVAFPMALFDLELSPGAFRTLAELCRMANEKGQCWPSLGQLGRKLGRSRGAMSGYVAELRSAGVLSTEEQRMANGYNYRLRYTLPFWKEWRARKVHTGRQKAERRVQPAKRPLVTKNQSHKKQLSPSVENHSDLVERWKDALRKAPYPAFESWPSVELIAQTQSAVAASVTPCFPVISTDIISALNRFFAARGVEVTAESLAKNASYLSKSLKAQTQLTAFLKALETQWQDHWKKPPNTFQLARMLKTLPAQDGPESQIKLLKTYLRRWEIYCENLPSGAKRSSVG